MDIGKWPGVGEKSAARLALHLLRAPKEEVLELAQALLELKEKIRLCRRCYAFADQELCPICADPGRQPGQLLVVAEPGDLLAIEKVGWFKGRYHVLGGSDYAPGRGRSRMTCGSGNCWNGSRPKGSGSNSRPQPQPGRGDHHQLPGHGAEALGNHGNPHRLRPAHGRRDQVRRPADLEGVVEPSGGGVSSGQWSVVRKSKVRI